MKKFVALALALMMLLAFSACGKKDAPAKTDEPDATAAADAAADEATEAEAEPADTDAEAAEAEMPICTPENFDKAIAAVKNASPTYEELVELFGQEGTVHTGMEYEGYSYYDWTDGSRTVLLTFKVDGDTQTYFSITGDFF